MTEVIKAHLSSGPLKHKKHLKRSNPNSLKPRC